MKVCICSIFFALCLVSCANADEALTDYEACYAIGMSYQLCDEVTYSSTVDLQKHRKNSSDCLEGLQDGFSKGTMLVNDMPADDQQFLAYCRAKMVANNE